MTRRAHGRASFRTVIDEAADASSRLDSNPLARLRRWRIVAIFGGLTSLAVGLASVLRSISATADVTPISWHGIAAGLAESMLGLFIAFSCLTIAWLLVTLGLSRN